ncbi:MAG: dTDP-4-dehydrorhamnose 3,5-epimerase [Syntrophales bacterium]
MPFLFSRLEITDVFLIETRQFPDERGYFAETYKLSDFTAAGVPELFVQDNFSCSKKGAIRGLHYQKEPMAQGKLVTVCCGEIFDVAVDIRQGSPTFGRWVGRKLTAANGMMLYIPPGFAHGFSVMSSQAVVSYKVTNEYAADLDRGIIWNDPDIGIPWHVESPLLSPKDAALPRLRDADYNFNY